MSTRVPAFTLPEAEIVASALERMVSSLTLAWKAGGNVAFELAAANTALVKVQRRIQEHGGSLGNGMKVVDKPETKLYTEGELEGYMMSQLGAKS